MNGVLKLSNRAKSDPHFQTNLDFEVLSETDALKFSSIVVNVENSSEWNTVMACSFYFLFPFITYCIYYFPDYNSRKLQGG